MLSLTILLTILATPVVVGLSAFFRLQPSENRIGITSYVEVLRIRANASAACLSGVPDADDKDDAGCLPSASDPRGRFPGVAKNRRFSVVTLAQ